MEDNLLARALSGLRPGREWFKFILLAVLLAAAISSFAGGQGEDPIETAKSLIEEKKYDEAVRILAEVVRRDPEKLDAVEELMAKIRAIRESFNEKYEELLEVLYEDKDVDKALVLIDELLEMDPNPNKATRTAVGSSTTPIPRKVGDSTTPPWPS